VCKKEYGWSAGLVYDHRGLLGVTTARPGVAEVLHFITLHFILVYIIYLLLYLFVFDEFIIKGERMLHKIGRTLLLIGWLKEETR
jgi:uncharacterized membrane protein YtjA (UPF0391 family)